MAQTWRSYGGTQHYEKSNNMSLNSLVVDNITIKSQYVGFFDISGKLHVGGTSTFDSGITVNGSENIYGQMYVRDTAFFYKDVSMGQSLAVTGSVVVDGKLTLNNDFVLIQDLNVGGNVYVANKTLALGYNFSSNTNDNLNYTSSLVSNIYEQGGFMGVNFPYVVQPLFLPGATLDVYSDASYNPNVTSALNVFCNSSKTQSILSSNTHHRGTVLYTDNSQCSLHWFSDTSMASTNTQCSINRGFSYLQYPFVTDDLSSNSGDATLVYQKGGEMLMATSKNLTLGASLSVGGRAYTFQQHVLHGRHSHAKEKVAIYSDTSYSVLPTVYESRFMDPSYQWLSALTMTTDDVSCSNGMMLTNGGSQGLQLHAGSYTLDAQRTMALTTLVLDTSLTTVPAQLVVSNTNPAFQRTVTGFNTYAPALDTYSMVINGRTRITSSEVVAIQSVSFELVGVVSARRELSRQTFLAYGAPCNYDGNFSFAVYTSLQSSGRWWSPVSLQAYDSAPLFANLSTSNKNMVSAAVAYNQRYGLVALSYGGYVMVSYDKYQTWHELLIHTSDGGFLSNGIQSMTVLDVSSGSCNLVVMVDVSNGNGTVLQQQYFLGYIFLDATHSFGPITKNGINAYYGTFSAASVNTDPTQMDASYQYQHFDTGMSVVNDLDGYDTSYVFVVGSGIQKYLIGSGGASIASTPVASWGSSYTYYKAKTLKSYTDTTMVNYYGLNPDPSYSVFVGAGIITYTRDRGKTFVDVSAGFRHMVFKDVDIVDVNNVVVTGSYIDACGGGGVVYATTDGVNWRSVYPAMNDGGSAAALLSDACMNLARDLRSLVYVTPSDFLVSRMDVSYHLDFSAEMSGNNIVYGSSQLYHCHVPNLFQSGTASVLDVCGSMVVSGSSSVTNLFVGGSAYTSSDYRLKSDVVDLVELPECSVDALRPVQYIHSGTGKRSIGFLAHEVQETFPYLVHGEKDDAREYQSVNYDAMIGILVKEVQELKREVKRLSLS